MAAFSVLSGGQVLAEELPADPANLEMVVTEEAQQEVNNVSNEELAAANEVIANSVEDTNVEAETSDLADTQTEASATEEDTSYAEEDSYTEDTSFEDELVEDSNASADEEIVDDTMEIPDTDINTDQSIENDLANPQ